MRDEQSQQFTKPEEICPDIPEWPERWRGMPEDEPYGEGLLAVMRPFMQHLIDSGLAKRTIRRHMDNLWLLGGKIISEVGRDQEYGIPPEEKLRDAVDSDGGPLLWDCLTESEQNAFDTTCRKLHAFLEQTSK
jgi:hypothetical protein